MENLNIFDVGKRFPCIVRPHNLPSNMPLGIRGIRNVMSDCLVDDIFILVFHCDDQRHNIRGVVLEGFEMSAGDVGVLSDEVTDSVNIIYISLLDVGYFIGSVGNYLSDLVSHCCYRHIRYNIVLSPMV